MEPIERAMQIVENEMEPLVMKLTDMAHRLEGVRFIGVMGNLPLFNDPLHGTTFSLSEGQTLGERLAEVDQDFTRRTL